MIKKSLTIFCIYMMLYISSAIAEQGYVSGIEDLPIPQGFEENEDESISYDTVGGRIVEAVYEGTGMVKDIKKYYEASLPQLGWKKISYRVYKRESEELTIDASNESEGQLKVTFTLRPALKKGFIHGE